jgi:hypothetical protein
MRPIWFFPLLALAACKGDDGLVVHNNPPTVVITFPVDGAEIEEGATMTFEGTVSDDGPVTDLNVIWSSSVTGTLEEGSPVDADGNVQYTTSALEDGKHTIVLRAFDAASETGEYMIDVTVVDVPDKPALDVVHPDLTGNEKGLDGSPFIFMVEVSDYQDPPEDLTVELLANPYGVVCTMTPDGSGTAQCPGLLPLGPYTLTFTVTDTDGNEAVANSPFEVVSRGDYDADKDGYSPNGGDCNDSNATIYPGADEICDGLDNDCNELTAIDVGTECYDDDGDGYCESPPCVNTSNTLGDCDDTNPSKYPNESIPEVPNGSDDDCDGQIDEGTNVYDDDGDGYCESPPCVNASGTEQDCNDAAYEINPGQDEVCGDGYDNDCNGYTNDQDAVGCVEFYYDNDGDTYGVTGATECWCDAGSYPYTGVNTSDCYDNNSNAWPGQTSYFPVDRGDGSYDYNCDGSNERQYTGTTGGCTWDFEPFECDIDGVGWKGAEPGCGKSGSYSDGCSGSYDAWCIFLCGGDPATCSSCWSCDADVATTTQACR